MSLSNIANSDTFGVWLSGTNQTIVAVNQLVVGNVLGSNVLLIATQAYANSVNAVQGSTGGVITGNLTFGVGGNLVSPTLVAYKEAYTNAGVQSTGSYTANLTLTNIFDVTLSNANTTITFINPASNGNVQSVTMIYRQPGTTANVINHGNTVIWSNGEVPVLASGIAGRLDVVTYMSLGGGIYIGAHSLANVGA